MACNRRKVASDLPHTKAATDFLNIVQFEVEQIIRKESLALSSALTNFSWRSFLLRVYDFFGKQVIRRDRLLMAYNAFR
jgi:hypothetical protein